MVNFELHFTKHFESFFKEDLILFWTRTSKTCPKMSQEKYFENNFVTLSLESLCFQSLCWLTIVTNFYWPRLLLVFHFTN